MWLQRCKYQWFINKWNEIKYFFFDRETEPNVAVALSDGTVVVCKFGNNQIANTNCLDTNSAPITGIKFGLNNNNLVYVGTNECVNVWDLRTDKPPIIKFKG